MTDTNWQQKKSFLFGVSTTTGGWEIPPSIVLQPTARISRAQVLHLNVHALKHVGYLLPIKLHLVLTQIGINLLET